MKPKLVLFISLIGFIVTVHAERTSLQDISRAAEPLPQATIYRAKEVITLNPARPTAEAVAVVGDRILAVGTVDELKERAGDQPYRVDSTFTDKVIDVINREREGVVFMLWGSYAQRKGAIIDDTRHCVLKAPHPSPHLLNGRHTGVCLDMPAPGVDRRHRSPGRCQCLLPRQPKPRRRPSEHRAPARAQRAFPRSWGVADC